MSTSNPTLREQSIFNFLYASGTGLLRGYARPDHLSDEQAIREINELVSEIEREIPQIVSEDRLPHFLGLVRKAIRRRHGGRNWPTTKIFLAATGDAISEFNAKSSTTDADELMIGRLIRWYKKFGNQMPSCGSAERTRKLIERGVLTADEARRGGFDMDQKMMDAAFSEEPRHHGSVPQPKVGLF